MGGSFALGRRDSGAGLRKYASPSNGDFAEACRLFRDASGLTGSRRHGSAPAVGRQIGKLFAFLPASLDRLNCKIRLIVGGLNPVAGCGWRPTLTNRRLRRCLLRSTVARRPAIRRSCRRRRILMKRNTRGRDGRSGWTRLDDDTVLFGCLIDNRRDDGVFRWRDQHALCRFDERTFLRCRRDQRRTMT